MTTRSQTKNMATTPGLFTILKPSEDAYPILRRVARASNRERTAKDFVDFFGNVGVIVHFGPLTAELIESDDHWRELIPHCNRAMEAEREIYTGTKHGQQFMFVYLTDKTTRAELPRWKELIRWIVERFY